MALEFLCDSAICREKTISIPERATHYRLKKGQILFFKVNPSTDAKVTELPSGINSLMFPGYQPHKFHIHYGTPVFYDSDGIEIK